MNRQRFLLPLAALLASCGARPVMAPSNGTVLEAPASEVMLGWTPLELELVIPHSTACEPQHTLEFLITNPEGGPVKVWLRQLDDRPNTSFTIWQGERFVDNVYQISTISHANAFPPRLRVLGTRYSLATPINLSTLQEGLFVVEGHVDLLAPPGNTRPAELHGKKVFHAERTQEGCLRITAPPAMRELTDRANRPRAENLACFAVGVIGRIGMGGLGC